MARPRRADDVVAGRFRLVEEIGRGGMGVVWRADDAQLGRPVALKVLLEDISSDRSGAKDRARFLDEARAAASIGGPNVVEVIDFGVDGDAPWIASALLSGESLATRLARVGRLSARDAASVVGGVAAALERAHALRIVHRDLKPSNVHLARVDDAEVVKVLDFGIAKFLEGRPGGGDATTTGTILGTTHYMSPEQARGSSDLDHRADLWSLAILAFQCVTGELPIRGDSMVDVIIAIVRAPIRAPSSVDPTLPPAFDAWFARATRRAPSERFGSGDEMARELSRALDVR